MPKTLPNRAGRPAKDGGSVRISPRFPENVAEILRQASALQGVPVTTFVVEASQRAAERVIDDQMRWRLGSEETAKLVALLADPPSINAAARKAEALATGVELRS